MQQLDHPLVAERIRFLPYSHHPRTTCMRVEIYGCPWTGKTKRQSHPSPQQPSLIVRPNPSGGLVSYTVSKSEPHKEPVDWAENLDDISYDGLSAADAEAEGHPAVAGLGQLTDGVFNDNRTSMNGSFFGSCLFLYILRSISRSTLAAVNASLQ